MVYCFKTTTEWDWAWNFVASTFRQISICVAAAGLCCLTPHKQANLKPHVRAWKSCPPRAPALQNQRKCRKLWGIFDTPVATHQSVRHNDQTTVVSCWPSGIKEIGFALWPLAVNYSQACLRAADNWPVSGDKAKERLGTMKKCFEFECVCVSAHLQVFLGQSIRVVWCAAAEVGLWAGWRQEWAQSSSGRVRPEQRCTGPVWLLTWLPPNASHPCEVEGVKKKKKKDKLKIGSHKKGIKKWQL